jgi:Ca2+-binding RTX toxin-like protein
MVTATELERYMLELVNEARAANGLPPLQLELNLNLSADNHSQWMTDNDTFSHTGVEGSSATDRMRDAGMDLSGGYSTAENLAAVSVSDAESYLDEVEMLHQNLMNSPSHYVNIMHKTATHIGIGIAFGPLTYGNGETRDSVLVTQNFATSGGRKDMDILGTATADRLTGDTGDDHIDAGDGDDQLNGQSGDDTLRGGAGTDTALFSGALADARMTERADGGVQVVSRDGTDILYDIEQVIFGDQSYDLDRLLNPPGQTLLGDDGDNALAGDTGDDTLEGGRGNDTLNGFDGADSLSAGVGDDNASGGAGNDLVKGGAGRDTLYGNDGSDAIRGQAGGDLMDGGTGADNIKGGGGNDTLLGGDGGDYLKGGTRRDSIEGGAGNDQLFGNSFDDTLRGGAGEDRLNAGGENDVLDGGTGNDLMKGGGGADVFEFADGDGADTISDFAVSEDVLRLESALANGQSATDIATSAQLTSDGVLLVFGDGDSILLQGLSTTANLASAIDIV